MEIWIEVMKPLVPEEREFECSNTDLNLSFGTFANSRTFRLPMPGGWSNCFQKRQLPLLEF